MVGRENGGVGRGEEKRGEERRGEERRGKEGLGVGIEGGGVRVIRSYVAWGVGYQIEVRGKSRSESSSQHVIRIGIPEQRTSKGDRIEREVGVEGGGGDDDVQKTTH
jgi:hypothetical protein